MLVESLFWFWPPVWLIGARLWCERERACDESVIALGHDREVYARAILKACKFCVHSPLACAAGVSGADLGRRVSLIMTGAAARRLDAPRAAAAGHGRDHRAGPAGAGGACPLRRLRARCIAGWSRSRPRWKWRWRAMSR